MCNAEFDLDMVVVAPGAGPRLAGLPAYPDLAAAGAIDCAVVTDLARPQATYDAIKAKLAAERILTPRLLRISRNGTA
ncbi:MAG: hypothetical protein KIT16_19715 [Rhodospirillaceae bacterium]|nr:hypothetical protein [Rhodospirillaceae bacterium]